MTPDLLKDFRKSHEEHAGYLLEGTTGCRPRAGLAHGGVWHNQDRTPPAFVERS